MPLPVPLQEGNNNYSPKVVLQIIYFLRKELQNNEVTKSHIVNFYVAPSDVQLRKDFLKRDGGRLLLWENAKKKEIDSIRNCLNDPLQKLVNRGVIKRIGEIRCAKYEILFGEQLIENIFSRLHIVGISINNIEILTELNKSYKKLTKISNNITQQIDEVSSFPKEPLIQRKNDLTACAASRSIMLLMLMYRYAIHQQCMRFGIDAWVQHIGDTENKEVYAHIFSLFKLEPSSFSFDVNSDNSDFFGFVQKTDSTITVLVRDALLKNFLGTDIFAYYEEAYQDEAQKKVEQSLSPEISSSRPFEENRYFTSAFNILKRKEEFFIEKFVDLTTLPRKVLKH